MPGALQAITGTRSGKQLRKGWPCFLPRVARSLNGRTTSRRGSRSNGSVFRKAAAVAGLSVTARAEEARAGRNAELVALRREEAELRTRLHGITEDVHGLELQIYEKRLQVSQLLERAASELGLGEEVLVAEYGPDVPVPEEAPLPPRQRSRADGGGPDDAEDAADD